MTEKRFKLSEPNGAYLIDDDKPLFHLDDSDDKIVELLNSLNDENEQLIQFINELTSRDGKIWLSSGYVYDVNKILKGGCGMTEKEVIIDLNELDIDIKQEIIFKSDLNDWIERKMSYYESMMEKTNGYNYVSAKGHLDMLIRLKEWVEQR